MDMSQEIEKLRIYNLRWKTRDMLFPPSYLGDKDYYDWKYKDYNCYAYAMQFTRIMCVGAYSFTPGYWSNCVPSNLIYSKSEDLLNALFMDLMILGIDYEEAKLLDELDDESYKINVYGCLSNQRDFHFARQNDDGSWSHKMGWKEKPELLDISDELPGFNLVKTIRISRKLS